MEVLRPKNAACRLLVLALVTGVSLWSSEAAAVSEYQVKAAYLYNFAQFVEWPESAFGNKEEPIGICIVGENTFGSVLHDAVDGMVVAGRQIVIREFQTSKPVPKCHMMFVSASERRRAGAILSDVRGQSVLTVGETEDFLNAGGIIAFKLRDARVRFEISAKAASAAGLSISSKLLRLADNVRKAGR